MVTNDSMHGKSHKPSAVRTDWWSEMAKPYSSSHIGFVSSGFTEMRLSGAVKEQLVEMLVSEIDRMVPAMESATLSATPDKKTLDDTNRTRLNYNRTRELMIERLSDSTFSSKILPP